MLAGHILSDHARSDTIQIHSPMLRIPSERYLRRLGPHTFANEVELQRFVEDKVASECGLHVIGSSLRGRQRLGFIDTLALHESGELVIIEYKLDTIDGDVLTQVARYKSWLLAHRETVEAAVRHSSAGLRIDWASIGIVTVAHRYDPSAVWRSADTSSVVFLRYRYDAGGTVSLETVDPFQTRSAVIGQRPPAGSKDHYLEQYLAHTTRAVREAFELLRRELLRCGFVETIYGKQTVKYRAGRRLVEVRFTDVSLRCLFAGVEDLVDSEGRTRVTRGKHGRRWTCGVVSPADVDYITTLITGAARESDESREGATAS